MSSGYKMSKGFKRFLLVLFILFVVISACILIFINLLFSSKTYTFITEYGDKFKVIYDDFTAKSILQDTKSSFHLTFIGELSKSDIKGLKCTSTLKVYYVQDTVFFDDGSGFELFSDDTDFSIHPELAEVARENMYSVEPFNKRYNELLYNSGSAS